MMKIKIVISLITLFIFLLSGVSQSLAAVAPAEDAALKGDWEYAYKILKSDESVKDDPAAKLLMGNICLATKRHAESALWFDSVAKEFEFTLWAERTEILLERHPYNPVAIYLQADANLRKGLINEAVEGFKLALKKKEDFYLARLALDNIQKEKDKYKQSISKYDETLKINPSDARAYYERGNAHYDKGETDNAIKDYSKSIEINPQSAEAYFKRGKIHYRKKRYSKAISDFTRAAEIQPDNPGILFNRGLAYEKLKYYDKAISDYTDVLKLDPENTGAYKSRGTAYYNKRQFEKAVADFTEALKINPGYINAYNNRGAAYDECKDYDNAIKDYSKAIELDPGYAKAYNNRGVSYFNKGLFSNAIKDYTNAIKIDPEYAEAYLNRGIVYLKKLDNKEKGCTDWKKACELGRCINYSVAKKQGDCE